MRNPYDHNTGLNGINRRFWQRQSAARDGVGSVRLDPAIAFTPGGIGKINDAFWRGTVDSTHSEAELSTPIDDLDNERETEDDEQEPIAASGSNAKSRDSLMNSCRCKMRDGERFAIPQ